MFAPLVASTRLAAQLPGLPLLQSPFVAPGIAVAVNAGHAAEVSAAGAAAAWASRSAAFLITGGAARVAREGANAGLGGGVRAYLPLKSFASEAVTAGVFAGVGGDRSRDSTTLTFPIGATVGYRRALGATRALSVYAVPFYSYTRLGGAGTNSSVLRAALGLDVAVTRRIGVTAGYEAGQKAGGTNPGIRSSVSGVGVAFAF